MEESGGQLVYSGLYERWEGEYHGPDGTIILIWMDSATFERYVRVRLVVHQRIEEPTIEQRQAAITYCRRFTYWLDEVAPILDDPHVHIRQIRPLPGTREIR